MRRRELLRLAGAAGAMTLSGRAASALAQVPTGETQEATAAEPWRKLIPRVAPPPRLPAPTPPGTRPDPAQIIALGRATAATLARADGWVMPSGYYPMLFTRDAYWILAAHRDPKVHAAVLARLRPEQHPDGQAPTALYIDGYSPPGRDNDDECTLLFVLMTYDAFRLGVAPDRGSLERAAGWLAHHAPQGRYGSSPGPYAYWLDTLSLAGDAPCVAYNQGLYAVALQALRAMGLPVDPAPAEAAYRATFDPAMGQIRCYSDRAGRFGQLRDTSALVGEALSWYYFDRPVLTREMVAATLATQPRAFYPDGSFLGFRNLTRQDGGPLPTSWMNDWLANKPGDYQNGASWVLYDALALYAGIRHGVPGAAGLLLDRLASETRRSPTLHEYIVATDDDPGGSDPRRDGYGWSSFVANVVESAAPALATA